MTWKRSKNPKEAARVWGVAGKDEKLPLLYQHGGHW